MKRAVSVGNTDYFSSSIMKEFSQETACVTETLNDNTSALHIKAAFFCSFINTDGHSLSRCFVAALRSTKNNWFTRNKARRVEFIDFAVFIVHPRHDLRVCKHIRCG